MVLIALLAIGLFSCEKEEISVTGINETDLSIIEQLGFNTNDVQDLGNAYLVEDDILLSKELLSTYYSSKQSSPKLKQARTESLISASNQRNITIRVDNSIPTDEAETDNWRPEVQQAIEHWNSLVSYECNLSFIYTTDSSADITIRSDQDSLNDGGWINGYWVWTLAAAEWPLNGEAGYQIRINLDTDNNRTFTSGQKVFNIVHEIGHCVGLRHTNWRYFGESPGIGVEGTPNDDYNPDPNSVMNGGTALNSWDEFSDYDAIAIRNMYPYIPTSTGTASADGPTYMSSSMNTVTWSYTGNVSNAVSYDWWYRKVGGASSILIASGTVVTFEAVSGTYYSDENFRTSNFKIYVKVHTSNDRIITSPEYEIMKKGMYDLQGKGGDIPSLPLD